MATSSSSIRVLLLPVPRSIQSHKSKINSSPLSFPTLNISSSWTHLSPQAIAKPYSAFHPVQASSLFNDAYNEIDDEFNYEEEEDEIEEVNLKEEVSTSHAEAGRLYVGNLPYSMNSTQLAEIFSQAGTVESAEIVCDRVTDRSRGFAFVTMASNEDANNAIRMYDGSQIGGRTVKVNFPEVPRGGEREMMGPPRGSSKSRGYVDSPYKVYCGNLGWTVTSESLKDAFFDQPGLLGAKVIYQHDSGRSRGFGFVTFSSAEEAQNAIQTMNGKEVGGRPLRLNLASERASTPQTVV